MMKRAIEKPLDCRFTSSLEENNFAEDIGLPRHTQEQMQKKIHKCKEEKDRFENE